MSKQALSQRFASLPAELFLEIFESVCERIRASGEPPLSERVKATVKQFSAVWMADGTTLSQLRKTLARTQEQESNPLAGKLMMVVEAWSHRPVSAWYDPNAQRSDQSWRDELLDALPTEA